MERPRQITWALIASLINGLAGLLFSLVAPDLEDRGTVIIVSAVFAAFLIGTGLLLWKGFRAGAIAAIVVNILSILLAVPGFFQGDAMFAIGAGISALLSAAVLYLILQGPGRDYWRT